MGRGLCTAFLKVGWAWSRSCNFPYPIFHDWNKTNIFSSKCRQQMWKYSDGVNTSFLVSSTKLFHFVANKLSVGHLCSGILSCSYVSASNNTSTRHKLRAGFDYQIINTWITLLSGLQQFSALLENGMEWRQYWCGVICMFPDWGLKDIFVLLKSRKTTTTNFLWSLYLT